MRAVRDQAYVLNSLGLAHKIFGQLGLAETLLRSSEELDRNDGNLGQAGYSAINLTSTLNLSGKLFESKSVALRALVISRDAKDRFAEAACLYYLGLTLIINGDTNNGIAALRRSMNITSSLEGDLDLQIAINLALTTESLWQQNTSSAISFLNQLTGLETSTNWVNQRIARVQGSMALELNDFIRANEYLNQALTRARAVNHVEEEIQTLISLAELRRRQGDLQAARELLDDVWEAAERGPYPLFHADALNVLAQIERDAGNTDKAVQAATEAYRKAWCDGPPFAYHWGLESARKHLAELGAAEPTDLPPYDESKYEPMPDVEIDPPDLPVEANSTDE